MKPFCDFCKETCNKITHGNKQVCPECFEKMYAAFPLITSLKRCGTCRKWGESENELDECNITSQKHTCDKWEIDND